ncbi:Uncharacterised protein [uncultured Clostridium sp.]|nr:Uncharacterised protein [uncultured Clostridium sp.]SCI82377.1 Uncharacterised protein [uncultured Clostridium sp.]
MVMKIININFYLKLENSCICNKVNALKIQINGF